MTVPYSPENFQVLLSTLREAAKLSELSGDGLSASLQSLTAIIDFIESHGQNVSRETQTLFYLVRLIHDVLHGARPKELYSAAKSKRQPAFDFVKGRLAALSAALEKRGNERQAVIRAVEASCAQCQLKNPNGRAISASQLESWIVDCPKQLDKTRPPSKNISRDVAEHYEHALVEWNSGTPDLGDDFAAGGVLLTVDRVVSELKNLRLG